MTSEAPSTHEAPGAAHREADRRRLLEYLGDLAPGRRVGGEDHQPVCVEAIHVERPVTDDELAAPGLDRPPLVVADRLAASLVHSCSIFVTVRR